MRKEVKEGDMRENQGTREINMTADSSGGTRNRDGDKKYNKDNKDREGEREMIILATSVNDAPYCTSYQGKGQHSYTHKRIRAHTSASSI